MIKNIVKKIIPKTVLQKRRQKIAAREQEKFAEKSVAETFSEIYKNNVWGGKSGEFFSGEGSTREIRKSLCRSGEKVCR